MKAKLRKILDVILARIGEQSTWQGIGFLVTLLTGKYAGMDWGPASALGGSVSAMIKTLLPDPVLKPGPEVTAEKGNP